MRLLYCLGLRAVSLPTGWLQTRRASALAGVLALAIVYCGFLTPAFAQSGDTIHVFSSPVDPANPSATEKYTVTGSVTDAVTGEPIRRALVQLNGQQPRTTFSDGDGHFQFEGVPATRLSISAQKPGFFGEAELPGHAQMQVEVGPKLAPILLKLTPESVIAGKVTSVTGMPLEHVPLRLTYVNVRQGRRRWEQRGLVNTDEDGRFRFANLQPGTYFVDAGPLAPTVEGLFEVEQKPKTGYSSIYYPGVPDLASATPIQLRAGQQAEANFALNEVAVYSVSGTISGYAPNQGVGILLLNQSETPLPIGVQFSTENGRFDLRGVPAGAYVLRAISSLPPNLQVRAETQLNVTSNVYNLHLALGPAASIPMVVRTESRAGASGIPKPYVGAVNQGPPLAVRLLANGPGKSDGYAGLEGPPGQQTLVLHGVEPGRYTVELIPQGSWYVQSAEYGRANLLTDDLVLTAGAPDLPIEVVMRNDGASLTVGVDSGDKKDGTATVVVIPERLGKATPRTVYYYLTRDKTAQNEGAAVNSLAPGDYLVLAFDHADNVEYSNPEILQNYLSQAAHVTVSANQQDKVTVDLIRTEEASN